jgi:hypothetical protein
MDSLENIIGVLVVLTSRSGRFGPTDFKWERDRRGKFGSNYQSNRLVVGRHADGRLRCEARGLYQAGRKSLPRPMTSGSRPNSEQFE